MIDGEALRATRKRLSLTQQALAESLGVTVSTIYKWENRADEFIPRKYWLNVKKLRTSSKKEAQLKQILSEMLNELDEEDLKDIINIIEKRVENGRSKNLQRGKRKIN